MIGRIYQINSDVTPYPDNLFYTDDEPVNGAISGYVYVNAQGWVTGQRVYKLSELTLISEKERISDDD